MFRKTIFLMDEATLTSNKHIYQPISVNEKASSWPHNSRLSIIWEMSLSRQLIMSGNKSVAHSWACATWGDNPLSEVMMFIDSLLPQTHTFQQQNNHIQLWGSKCVFHNCHVADSMPGCDHLVWNQFSTRSFQITRMFYEEKVLPNFI